VTEPPSWLTDPELGRIWRLLLERLEARGLRPEGRVVIASLTRAERHAASALVGRTVTRSTLTVELADIDRFLAARSGIGGLVAVLEAVTGRVPVDRPGRRADRATARDAPYRLARERLAGADWLPEWLDGVRRSGLLSRASDPVAAVRHAAEVLGRLSDEHRSASRTELAAALAGGAHGLDDGRTVTALVLRGLAAQVGESPPATAAARRALWERFAVSVDSVSTTCLTLGLRAAGTGPGCAVSAPGSGSAACGSGSVAARLALAADAGDPVHLTAWDLRRATLAVPARVLVCENPRVLEAVAERRRGAVPVVCVSGQPALVVLDVLRGLAGAELRYHGDFDWPGIAIANRLIAEVGVRPWRMSADDYLAALGPARPALAGPPVEPAWDAELGPAMRHHSVAVHEESVLDRLLAAL
jgi:uncharacterized protein (TIGR02679 family)